MWRNFTRNYCKIFKLLNVRYQGEPLGCNFFYLNYDFFYEFFDLFSKVNGSDCYVMFSNKPKYGPYNGLKYDLPISMF